MTTAGQRRWSPKASSTPTSSSSIAKSPDLADLDIVGLDPFLRGLLFTDGTVSRALEAHTLSRVSVAPVEQVVMRCANRPPATWPSARADGACAGA